MAVRAPIKASNRGFCPICTKFDHFDPGGKQTALSLPRNGCYVDMCESCGLTAAWKTTSRTQSARCVSEGMPRCCHGTYDPFGDGWSCEICRQPAVGLLDDLSRSNYKKPARNQDFAQILQHPLTAALSLIQDVPQPPDHLLDNEGVSKAIEALSAKGLLQELEKASGGEEIQVSFVVAADQLHKFFSGKMISRGEHVLKFPAGDERGQALFILRAAAQELFRLYFQTRAVDHDYWFEVNEFLISLWLLVGSLLERRSNAPEICVRRLAFSLCQSLHLPGSLSDEEVQSWVGALAICDDPRLLDQQRMIKIATALTYAKVRKDKATKKKGLEAFNELWGEVLGSVCYWRCGQSRSRFGLVKDRGLGLDYKDFTYPGVRERLYAEGGIIRHLGFFYGFQGEMYGKLYDYLQKELQLTSPVHNQFLADYFGSWTSAWLKDKCGLRQQPFRQASLDLFKKDISKWSRAAKSRLEGIECIKGAIEHLNEYLDPGREYASPIALLLLLPIWIPDCPYSHIQETAIKRTSELLASCTSPEEIEALFDDLRESQAFKASWRIKDKKKDDDDEEGEGKKAHDEALLSLPATEEASAGLSLPLIQDLTQSLLPIPKLDGAALVLVKGLFRIAGTQRERAGRNKRLRLLFDFCRFPGSWDDDKESWIRPKQKERADRLGIDPADVNRYLAKFRDGLIESASTECHDCHEGRGCWVLALPSRPKDPRLHRLLHKHRAQLSRGPEYDFFAKVGKTVVGRIFQPPGRVRNAGSFTTTDSACISKVNQWTGNPEIKPEFTLHWRSEYKPRNEDEINALILQGSPPDWGSNDDEGAWEKIKKEVRRNREKSEQGRKRKIARAEEEYKRATEREKRLVDNLPPWQKELCQQLMSNVRHREALRRKDVHDPPPRWAKEFENPVSCGNCAGQKVKHKKHGLGVITVSDGQHTTVRFYKDRDNGYRDKRTRKFLTSSGVLELLGEKVEEEKMCRNCKAKGLIRRASQDEKEAAKRPQDMSLSSQHVNQHDPNKWKDMDLAELPPPCFNQKKSPDDFIPYAKLKDLPSVRISEFYGHRWRIIETEEKGRTGWAELQLDGPCCDFARVEKSGKAVCAECAAKMDREPVTKPAPKAIGPYRANLEFLHNEKVRCADTIAWLRESVARLPKPEVILRSIACLEDEVAAVERDLGNDPANRPQAGLEEHVRAERRDRCAVCGSVKQKAPHRKPSLLSAQGQLDRLRDRITAYLGMQPSLINPVWPVGENRFSGWPRWSSPFLQVYDRHKEHVQKVLLEKDRKPCPCHKCLRNRIAQLQLQLAHWRRLGEAEVRLRGRAGRCPRCSTVLFTLTELPKYSQWAQWRVDGKRMKVPFSKCPKCNFELLSSELPSQGDSRTEKRTELITPDILRMVANLEAEIAALETDQSHGIPTFPLHKATSECTTSYEWSADIPDRRKLPTLFEKEPREEAGEEQEESADGEDSGAEGEGE